jgi:hypothetical protein
VYDDHPMLAKIRKLLAKAENDATTAEEAELYTAKAAQLVADYGIDQALLNAEAPGRDGDGVSDRLVTVEAPYAADKADLLATVACRLRCRTVRVTERTAAGREFAVHLFGHEPDLVRTDLLFTSLLLQASTWMMRTPVPPLEHKAAFRRSWLAGFRMSIARRLEDAERVAEQSASSSAVGTDGTGKSAARSTSLVLADRVAAVEQALRDVYPYTGRASRRSLSGGGMRQGWLGGVRVASRAPRALG